MREPLLFATPPRANATRTSLAAADQVADRCPTCRERIAAFLRAVGPGGATHEEIAGNTGVRLDTVKPRGRELEPWPVRRIDWRARALDAERRAAEAERRLRELKQQGV